jgi:hypothetical protein
VQCVTPLSQHNTTPLSYLLVFVTCVTELKR